MHQTRLEFWLFSSGVDVYLLELVEIRRGAKSWNWCMFFMHQSQKAELIMVLGCTKSPTKVSKAKDVRKDQAAPSLPPFRRSDTPACGDGRRSWCDCQTVGVSGTACHTARSRNWSLLPPVVRHEKPTWFWTGHQRRTLSSKKGKKIRNLQWWSDL